MAECTLITPDWSAPANVKALTTSRLGGVSQAPFDSLNLGMHVDDQVSDVLANRTILIESQNLPSEPVWLEQVHSTKIVELNSTRASHQLVADGAITREEKIVCAVMTADCLPLFLSNRSGDKVAVLHVGWRGLAQGIIEKGVAMFNDSAQNIIAWAGPCISMQHFEIGAEVRAQLGGSESAYRKSSNETKFYADMYKLTAERLALLGVNNYSHSTYCSYQDEDLFFSHRRDQSTGRMVSLIWFE